MSNLSVKSLSALFFFDRILVLMRLFYKITDLFIAEMLSETIYFYFKIKICVFILKLLKYGPKIDRRNRANGYESSQI